MVCPPFHFIDLVFSKHWQQNWNYYSKTYTMKEVLNNNRRLLENIGRSLDPESFVSLSCPFLSKAEFRIGKK